ncbi:MAG: peptide chain release factor N(5)-glutamine methyltransferase [Proteobacteria bacterium]|nr:peptide chain release factor N(5)-glutamine methyltransferase [Pseudomonadota bacterium]
MTVTEWRVAIEKAFLKAGYENPHQEAKWLLAGALHQENVFIILNPHYNPTRSETLHIQEWLKRRLAGEPLSRIKGMREFWSLPFHLNKDTLDPRPETETIIEGVLQWIGNRTNEPWRILDLGTGSGCILISLLHDLTNSRGWGVDINEEALSIANFNAAHNNVSDRATFLHSNWGKELKERFDIIVSNPPYIPLAEREELQTEVLKHDPSLALFGGEDGLDCYRILVCEIKRLLSPKGIAVLEMGFNQRQEIEELFHQAEFKIPFILQDLAGIDRVIGVCL